MTPERWKQVDQLLQDALDREPAEREAFLAEACEGDEELRREVESLLGFHERAESFIEKPPAEMAADWLNEKNSRAGQTIGHYHLIRQIGRGGMGEVYLARDTRLGRQVALKLLQASLTQDAGRLRRFRQEARAVSALNHPNIITLHEIGEAATPDGVVCFIATEFVEGRTLREALAGDGLTLGEALDVAQQIASALAAAHAAGIVHRDIKPENIMARADGLVKVLDFGIAKLTRRKAADAADASFSTVHTNPGLIMGTVSYMSPEQARGLEVDARSDIFSLGVALYELITGRAPFSGATTADVLVSILEREPAPLARSIPDAPAELQRVVSRALAKDREARYQDAGELSLDLNRLRQKLDPAARLKRVGGASGEAVSPNQRAGQTPGDDDVTERPTVAFEPGESRLVLERGRLYGYMQRHPRQVLALLLFFIFLAFRYVVLPPSWRSWNSGEEINSVAVLPFANVGADPQTEYLPDGITENLIDSLLRLPDLRVSAYGTVSGYKGRAVDPRQVGKELQVRAVVAGRVVWQGDELIIHVELINSADGSRLWSDEFRRARSNIVTAHGDIAREIAATLHRRLSPASQRQLDRRHSADGRAYELYHQGRFLHSRYDRESMRQAIDYFRRAIALDTNYALAYCGLADVYADLSSQHMPPAEAIPHAREAALKAIELDETLAEAHHSMALVKLWGGWDWAGAEREYKRALELDPNLFTTRIYYAEMLSQQGRFEEALREIKRVRESDPASLRAMVREAYIYFLMRQYDRAIETYNKILELSPNSVGIKRDVAVTLSHQGKHAEAVALVSPLQSPTFLPAQAYIYARAGRRDEAMKLLRELNARAARERVSPLSFARVYAGFGDKEQALAWLRKGHKEQSDHLVHIGTDPSLDLLRSDPRFVELLRRIGLAR